MTQSSNIPDSYFQGSEDYIIREQLEFALIFYRFNPKVRYLSNDELYKLMTQHWQEYTASDEYRTPDSSTYECCYAYIANFCNNIV